MTHEEQNGLVEALFPNVDNWGAREWFQRLVNAVKNRNASVNAGDDISFENYNNIASATASRLANEYADEILAALQAPQDAGVEKTKLYHSQWPTEDLLKARGPHGLLTDDGEAWKYEYTHSDAQGGVYDLVYRPIATLSQPAAQPAHPDDLAVDRFAVAMKAKLAKKRAEGRGGWDNPEECSIEYLSYLLVQHLWKGDPVDVGNLAMMIQQRGGRIVFDDETKAIAPSTLSQPEAQAVAEGCHGLDTPERVCFYEQDFYVLSNFSSFSIMWPWTPRDGVVRFDTSEAVYHFMKFKANVPTAKQWDLMRDIRDAPSAHEAFKIAERNKHLRRRDWDDVKVDIMRDILRAKADQHEYVRRKLLATGDRELVENSWRDDFWGWGPNRDGKNMLGKLWMEVRAELRRAASPDTGGA